MPPPMPNPAKRFTANPAKPVGRYRPGKAVQEEEDSDEEGFETEEEDRTPAEPQPRRPQATSTKPPAKQAAEPEEDDEEGFVTDEDDEGEQKPSVASDKRPTQAAAKTAGERLATTTTHSDSTSEEEESEESSSEEEDSSESEPEPARKFQRPTFIKKADRNRTTSNSDSAMPATADSTADPAEEARRKEMAELMIKDELEKAAAARLAGKKYWDDDENLAQEDMVDDTDGLDPVLERKAWEVRELKRLKRDRERIEAREKEIEEVERRRNLSKEERETEDAEFLANQREERDGNRGEAGFMKKYYHKGAFFMDDEDTKRLTERNIMGRTFQDEVDKSTLPEYMRVRDLNKLGKTGGTKYKDLRSEDTGRFGDEVKRWRPGDSRARDGDGMIAGVDERFLSDRDRERLGPTSSGANATAVGTRRPRKSPSRSQSRSRSPARRKRSISPYRDRDDKRRRTEVDT